MCQRWQRTPNGQVWSVIHIERCKQQDVRKSHATHMHPQPPGPEPTSGHSADEAGTKGQNTENKKMIVGWPSKNRKSGHRKEHHHETPIVDGTGRRMSTLAFGSNHCHYSGNSAGDACGYMYRHDTKKRGRG